MVCCQNPEWMINVGIVSCDKVKSFFHLLSMILGCFGLLKVILCLKRSFNDHQWQSTVNTEMTAYDFIIGFDLSKELFNGLGENATKSKTLVSVNYTRESNGRNFASVLRMTLTTYPKLDRIRRDHARHARRSCY